MVNIFDDRFLVFFFTKKSFVFSGGFYGCEHAITDVRCRLSAWKFYSGEAFDSATRSLSIQWSFLCIIVLITYSII